MRTIGHRIGAYLKASFVWPHPIVAAMGRWKSCFLQAPDHPEYNQVNFRVPSAIAPGPAVPVRFTYLTVTAMTPLWRPSETTGCEA